MSVTKILKTHMPHIVNISLVSQLAMFHKTMVLESSQPSYGDYMYPEKAKTYGWLCAVLPIIVGLLLGILHDLLTSKGNCSEVCIPVASRLFLHAGT